MARPRRPEPVSKLNERLAQLRAEREKAAQRIKEGRREKAGERKSLDERTAELRAEREKAAERIRAEREAARTDKGRGIQR